MKRRDFFKAAAAGAGGLAAMQAAGCASRNRLATDFPTSGGMGIEEAMWRVNRGKARNVAPKVRPEILSKPRAVFLIETHVDARKDESGHFTEAVPQLRSEGTRIARELFVKSDARGGCTYIKPNFTFVPEHCYNRTTGVYSSPDFIAGMVNHLRDIGNTNVIAGEGPTESRNHRMGGVYDAFDEVSLPMIEAGYNSFSDFRPDELNWVEVKDSLVWKRIPYFKPIMDPDTFMINVSSLKCHLTGLTTLTVKNLQGCVPKGYGQFCTAWNDLEPAAYRAGVNFKRDFQEDYHQRVEASFLRHRAANFKRWDPFESYAKYEAKGGWDVYKTVKDDEKLRREFMSDIPGALMRFETWMHRGLMNAHVLSPDLNIVEGIIGLDGEELNRDRIGDDQLVNIIIAGCSPFEVDAVGTYLMGHDPREIWYTRVAKELGFGECDVDKIEIYRIADGEIIPVRNKNEIKRHPLGLNWARKADPDQRLFW